MVWKYIDYLRREKKTTIFLTTHYMEEVRDADRVVILDKGHIVADDTPARLKNMYANTKLIWYFTLRLILLASININHKEKVKW